MARRLQPDDLWLEHASHSVAETAPWDWDLTPLSVGQPAVVCCRCPVREGCRLTRVCVCMRVGEGCMRVPRPGDRVRGGAGCA